MTFIHRKKADVKYIRLALLFFAILLILAAAGFVLWAGVAARPMPEALAALASNANIQVLQDDWITFLPRGLSTSTALIFYPGGRVDPRAYAPTARALAESGYPVVIVRMPLNLAVLAPNRAAQVVEAHPEVENWVIGGHSLGGAMAARFVYQNQDSIDGLLLMASYPAQSDDLSSYDLQVTSLYGTLDGLASIDEIQTSAERLPPDTLFIPIDGGNHAQFGWYGRQNGDLDATISRTAQQEVVIKAALELLTGISSSAP